MHNTKNQLWYVKVSTTMTGVSQAGKERWVLGFNEVRCSFLEMRLQRTGYLQSYVLCKSTESCDIDRHLISGDVGQCFPKIKLKNMF